MSYGKEFGFYPGDALGSHGEERIEWNKEIGNVEGATEAPGQGRRW